MRGWIFSLTMLVPAAAGAQQVEAVLPLTLERVLESVDRNYPSLLAALKEREIADAKRLSAEGEFDLKLKSQAIWDPIGYYINRRYDTYLEQPTPFYGATFAGGYRIGTGYYSSSDITKLETLSDGEWRGGFRLPLLRDGATDRRRTDLTVTSLGQRLASLSIEQQRIAIARAASKRYWDWVAAGRRYEIAKNLLKLAEVRNNQIKETVELGQLAPIELTDNERAILQRQGEVVASERILQQAAIELSLYYRDDTGEPKLPIVQQLPPAMPEPKPVDLSKIPQDIADALGRRPEVLALGAERDISQAEARLARNQLLPNLDVYFGYSRDRGFGNKILQPVEVETGVTLEIPLQRRKATGKLRAEQAKIEQINLKERLARDRVGADIRDAYSALQAAFDRLRMIRGEVQVAFKLEDAERARFELGDSTLFLVNLRELATADAALREVNAIADYHRFNADYVAAMARATP